MTQFQWPWIFLSQIWFIWFILRGFLSLQVSTSISESLQHKKTWVPKLFWNISHPTQLTCKIKKCKFKCIWKLELSSRIRGYQYFDISIALDVTLGYLLQKLLLRLQITMPLHINTLHYEYASIDNFQGLIKSAENYATLHWLKRGSMGVFLEIKKTMLYRCLDWGRPYLVCCASNTNWTA